MSTEEKEEILVWCSRADEDHPVKGGATSVCCECGCGVYLSPSTVNIVKEHPTAHLMCPQCAHNKIAGQAGIQIMPPNKEQIQELVESGAFDDNPRWGVKNES